ncbi:hypothetical protein Tco_0097021 [Tanacetum coccineum]
MVLSTTGTLHYTPQHMVSREEKQNPTGYVRSMMSQTTLPKSFWDYALENCCHAFQYGSKLRRLKDTIRKYGMGKPLSLSYLKDKPKETMGYSFYYPPENKVLVAQNAEFLENSLINQEASGSLEDLEIIQEEDTHPSIDTSLNHEEDDLEIDEPQK